MALYEYRCSCGEVLEVLASPGEPPPACPACGSSTTRRYSGFAVGGRADPGPSQQQMPQTWRGTYGANPEYVTGLRRQWERRQRLEERHPELAGDRRPVVAHEGPYAAAPLRAGDPVPGAGGEQAPAPGAGHAHGHSHAHGHPHAHPQPGGGDRSGAS